MEEYRKRGAEILGMSFDSVEANRAFAEKLQFPFKLLSDVDRKVGLAYGACETPSQATAKRISYLIDPEGKIVQSWGTTSKLDTKAHAEEVLREIPAA